MKKILAITLSLSLIFVMAFDAIDAGTQEYDIEPTKEALQNIEIVTDQVQEDNTYDFDSEA